MKRKETGSTSRFDQGREEDSLRGDHPGKSDEGRSYSDEQCNAQDEDKTRSDYDVEEWTDEEFEGQEARSQPVESSESNDEVFAVESKEISKSSHSTCADHSRAFESNRQGDTSTCRPAAEGASGKDLPGEAPISHQEDDYHLSEFKLSQLEVVLQNLKEFTKESWAECNKDQLIKRQSNIALLVQHTMDLIHHGTGCPGLCTDIECPNPTVIGAPGHSNRPILPSPPDILQQEQRNLHEYFKALLQWQGGVDSVPYSMIAEQNSKGEYDIVSHHVYPSGASQFQSPFEMTAEETRIWTNHILEGDRMQIPEERRFQFDLPRPGLRVNAYQSQRAPQAKIQFLPHALAYARILNSYSIECPSPRTDQLPIFQSYDVPYSSLTPEDFAGFKACVRRSQKCVDMLEALNEFDICFPVHAGVDVWRARSKDMPHLKSQPPSPSSSVDHLVADRGWLPPECYDASHPDYYWKGIVRLLAWSHPRNLTHSKTNTLLGGPYGAKWAVLLLCHIQINVYALEANWDEAVDYYGDLAVRGKVYFLDRDHEQLQIAIEAMTAALTDSTINLRSSMDQRRVVDVTELATRHARQSHENYPTSSDGFIFHTLYHDRISWESAAAKQRSEKMQIDCENRGTPTFDTTEDVPSRKGKEKAMTQAERKRSKRNHSGDYAETGSKRTRC
ncbi:hypothetical protein BN14_11405 [Rhizoctonia solani AG-1 IB]|uniref:Uncharacterized protein n=1 Tax=Thanatephorus cucumeris (strain AG1-IB / isolate 7/3/14) TaxID=1108050 RepID=M5CDN3_THACB|nr:hypothetical protein BN14_11405 [Rhizoctonia solani AG-1 IB]